MEKQTLPETVMADNRLTVLIPVAGIRKIM